MSVPARAGLVGNPSDLYRGAVLAVPVRAFEARVEHADAPALRIVGEPGGHFLVEAALRRASARVPMELRWETNIPRSVGLAGSSAIVIATLKVLGERDLGPSDPMEQAILALAVERDDLGIVAGLQDRAVQAIGQPVLVDLAHDEAVVTQLVPRRPIRILVAWCDAAADDSGSYHRRLRERGENLATGMVELGELARAAGRAFEAGDATALQDLMGASAALRNRVAPLSPAHETLSAAVRRAGFTPNSTGSGGAVAAVMHDASDTAALQTELESVGGHFVEEVYP